MRIDCLRCFVKAEIQNIVSGALYVKCIYYSIFSYALSTNHYPLKKAVFLSVDSG